MSAPDLPRFKVSSDNYSVLDTWNAHLIVVNCANTKRDRSSVKREAFLAKRCAELEQWHTEAMRDA